MINTVCFSWCVCVCVDVAISVMRRNWSESFFFTPQLTYVCALLPSYHLVMRLSVDSIYREYPCACVVVRLYGNIFFHYIRRNYNSVKHLGALITIVNSIRHPSCIYERAHLSPFSHTHTHRVPLGNDTLHTHTHSNQTNYYQHNFVFLRISLQWWKISFLLLWIFVAIFVAVIVFGSTMNHAGF